MERNRGLTTRVLSPVLIACMEGTGSTRQGWRLSLLTSKEFPMLLLTVCLILLDRHQLLMI